MIQNNYQNTQYYFDQNQNDKFQLLINENQRLKQQNLQLESENKQLQEEKQKLKEENLKLKEDKQKLKQKCKDIEKEFHLQNIAQKEQQIYRKHQLLQSFNKPNQNCNQNSEQIIFQSYPYHSIQWPSSTQEEQ